MAVAKKKRRRKKKQGISINWKDERYSKILGGFLLLLGCYLFIAFCSHLFTWKVDQDVFNPFSWAKLINGEILVENWLGRLGAAVSNLFFFWGFGLPSFILVVLFMISGGLLIQKKPLVNFWPLAGKSILVMATFSILFSFVFRNAVFPWGGAFGMGVSSWLVAFLGNVGTFALFLFVGLTMVTWVFNPNFDRMQNLSLLQQAKWIWNDIISGKIFSGKPTAPPAEVAIAVPQNKPLQTLRPRGAKNDEPTGPGIDLSLESSSAQQPDKAEANTQSKGEQLAFKLKNKGELSRPASLKIGEAKLEIEENAAQESTANTVQGEDGVEITVGELLQPNMVIQDENKTLDDPYDPTLELRNFENPGLDLLGDYSDAKLEIDRAELEQNKDQIIETLLNYKIEITKIKATIGPTVTLYEIVPAPGVRISKIKNLEDDIALSLAALGIRIIAPIPGKGTIGIEVPNKNKQTVGLRETLSAEKFTQGKMDLPIALGKTISNEVFVADLAKMPHLLIAGATGQGKSVGINVILMSLLYKKHPSQIKFVMIDPKKVELFPYAKLENHFLAYLPGLDEPIVTDTTKVVHTLNSLLIEMDERYNLLKKAKARNITEYNKKFVARKLNPNNGHRFMPFIVLVIDEFADLIMTAGKEIEHPIGRLAQLSRAVGIHLIIATQRPSVNIITGVIKANFPARIAYKVSSKVDSRTILDAGGADRLIGRGDMLLSFGSDTVRLQCAFVDTPEVEAVIDSISEQRGYPTPYYLPEYTGEEKDAPGAVNVNDLDEKFEAAARLVVQNQHGSTSMIQRRLKLGYNRAGRITDQLEALGIVGPSEGSKPREVLVFDEVQLERYLEDIRTRK
ncbi:MAG: DNA translocase FtsK [Saprospiraceae bacterium]|nr:DNA translocase FtsK [Saprospiraceae bacterium]